MRARVLGTLVAAGMLLLALLCVYLLLGSGETRSVILKDGTKLSIRELSYGKEHRHVEGPAWHRLLAKGPTNIAKLFGVKSRIDRYPEDTLVVVLESDNPSNQNLSRQKLRVLDSNGLGGAFNNIDRIVSISNQVALTSFRTTSFPRHQPVLGFEWFVYSPTNLMFREEQAIFQVKNPWYTTKATSPLPPWPANADFHGEKFTLLGINSGLHATGTLAANYLSNQWTEFLFRIGTNEPAQRTTNALELGAWVLKSVELWDSFGNHVLDRDPQGRIFPRTQGYMMRKDDGIGLVHGAIWPDQLWNVRAEFQRTLSSPDTHHTWTTSIPVPLPGESLRLQETGQIEACEIILASIEREGRQSSSIPERSPPPILSFLSREGSRVLPKPLVAGSYVLRPVHVEDQRGSNIVHWFRGSDKGTNRYELRAAPESTELKVTFAAQHSIMVELSGKASILHTNVAHWTQ